MSACPTTAKKGQSRNRSMVKASTIVFSYFNFLKSVYSKVERHYHDIAQWTPSRIS